MNVNSKIERLELALKALKRELRHSDNTQRKKAGRPAIDSDTRMAAVALREEGCKIRSISRLLGISEGSVSNVLRAGR